MSGKPAAAIIAGGVVVGRGTAINKTCDMRDHRGDVCACGKEVALPCLPRLLPCRLSRISSQMRREGGRLPSKGKQRPDQT